MNVSILITAYKRAELFQKSLPSILDQLTLQDEIVFVNDGEPDGAEAILKGALVSDGRAQTPTLIPIPSQYIDTGNRGYHGCGRAKNIGLKACKNELIIIRDPEVEDISPCINQLRTYFEKQENKRKYVNAGSMYFSQDENQSIFKESNFFIGHSNAPFVAGVMKEELMAVQGWREDFKYWGNDDSSLMHRLGNNGVSIECDETMVAWHQWHDRPPQEALGDFNLPLLNAEGDGFIKGNEGKEWGIL